MLHLSPPPPWGKRISTENEAWNTHPPCFATQAFPNNTTADQYLVHSLPQLQIVALGSLTYRDVWDGTIVDGYVFSTPQIALGKSDLRIIDRATKIDNVLRLRVWAIQHMKNFRNKVKPALSLVALGYPGNVSKNISENMRIFEPYWLH